jgi:chemotaxis signal transduction protein
MKKLLLINFDGLVYGIWESDVLAIEDLPVLHSLPATPAYVAGVAIIRDRTVMLADLSVCIGHVPMERIGTGHALLLSDTESFAGFAVEEVIRHASVASDSVYPMPEYLKTPVVDSCVVVDSILVPVVNMSVLYSRLQKAAYQPASAQFSWAGSRDKAASVERIRLFEISDGIFGASTAGMEEAVEEPGPLSRLFVAPPFVAGMVFHKGRILPVFDLLQRLSLQERGQGEVMLVAEFGNSPFGFLIHGDEGFVKREDIAIKSLPPMVQSGWIQGALEHTGEIVPLLDLEEILRIGPDMTVEKPLPQRYTPDSGFIDVFDKEDVSVLEFSLLGQRHALPRAEVKDNIGFKPYREIPNTPEIVIGVAAHNQELLPVLDLAMVFGRRSLVTPEWRMLHIKNGDFQALVITETVFGERLLPVNMQREVPIVLPHNVVYGCYPDANSVQLILNVEALAVHFEKTLVQELLPAMTPEMKQAPAEIVSSLLGESMVSASRPVMPDTSEGQHVPQEPEAANQPAESEQVTIVPEQPEIPEAAEVSRFSAEAEEARKLEEISGSVQEHQEVTAALQGGETKADQVPTEPFLTGSEEQAAQPVQESSGEPEPTRIEAAIEEVLKEDTVQRQTAAIPAISPLVGASRLEEQKKDELLVSPTEKILEQASQEHIETVHEEPSVVEPEIPTITQKTEAISQQPSPVLEQEVPEEDMEPFSVPIVEGVKSEENIVPFAEQIFSRPEQETPVYEAKEEKQTALGQTPEDQEIVTSPRSWNRRFAYGAIGGVLVLLLFIGTIFWQTDAGKKEKPDQAGKSSVGTVEAAKKKPKIKTAQKKTSEPFVLTVPSDVTLDIDNYIVKKGDTLWGISERFTGNPFNYPRIAGENLIENPDLIFPEQKIIIKKKEK